MDSVSWVVDVVVTLVIFVVADGDVVDGASDVVVVGAGVSVVVVGAVVVDGVSVVVVGAVVVDGVAVVVGAKVDGVVVADGDVEGVAATVKVVDKVPVVEDAVVVVVVSVVGATVVTIFISLVVVVKAVTPSVSNFTETRKLRPSLLTKVATVSAGPQIHRVTEPAP